MSESKRPRGGTKSLGDGGTAKKTPAGGAGRKTAAKATAQVATAAKPRAKPSRSAPGSRSKSLKAPPELNTREKMIAECAYYFAERRGFGDGGALDDWLAAEREIDASLPPR